LELALKTIGIAPEIIAKTIIPKMAFFNNTKWNPNVLTVPISLNVLYYSHVMIVIAGPHDFRKLESLWQDPRYQIFNSNFAKLLWDLILHRYDIMQCHDNIIKWKSVGFEIHWETNPVLPVN